VRGGGQRSFRPAAATPAERVRWPADWGTRFLLFVDVEEEFDWTRPPDRVQRATTAMRAFPDAHRRFADAGVALACMVDYPVAVDPDAAAILREVVADGRSTVGAQLHAWVTPPFDEPLTPANSYAGNLPRALEAAKLDTITAAIEDAMGERPIAYRAGRYGIGAATPALLRERGYRVDSSIRARYDYGADGGPDFSAVDAHAFRRDGLLELPLTTMFTGPARRWGPSLHAVLDRVPHARGAASRTGLLSRVALTPEDMPIAAARAAVDAAIADALGLLVFSFHSPSLVPGHTPYVRDAGELAGFWRWWSVMLDHLGARGVRPTTLAAVLAAVG
jgi:hypothetical protein